MIAGEYQVHYCEPWCSLMADLVRLLAEKFGVDENLVMEIIQDHLATNKKPEFDGSDRPPPEVRPN